MRKFDFLKKGDEVVRMLAGSIPCKLIVLEVRGDRVICGNELINGVDGINEGWTFDLATGAEIDDDLGWGPPPKFTGSFLVKT